jgi:hypothetical protein
MCSSMMFECPVRRLTDSAEIDTLLSTLVDSDALFGDDAADELARCNVKAGVVDFLPFLRSRTDTIRCDMDDHLSAGQGVQTSSLSRFDRRSLFDVDPVRPEQRR